jgi:hypothetical protein
MNNTAICEELLKPSDTQNGKNSEAGTIRREDIQLELDLAWLAGLIDGEGCLTTHFWNDKKAPTRPKTLICSLVVSNSNKLALEKAQQIYESIGVKSHLIMGKRENRKFWVGSLSIRGNYNLSTIIPRLLPYLVIKKDQAISLLAIVYRKVTLGEKTNGKRGLSLTYDEFILTQIKKLHELKQEGRYDIPSTTIRSALLDVEGDDIVCSA